MFPVTLCLRGARCLVVGGGGVALRKVESLLAEGAIVTVVAPEPAPRIIERAAHGQLELARRSYQPAEAADYSLVFAATDSRAVNQQVAADATAGRVWVNVADDPELCTFQLPARVRRGALQIAVASAGEAPFVVRRLRQLRERPFGQEGGPWLAAAARFRRAVRERALSAVEQEARFDRFFAATVAGETLRARVPSAVEVELMLGAPPVAATVAAQAAPASVQQREGRPATGFVSLIGAGPGDPGLVTLRAHSRLLAADAVVYDRLAAGCLPPELEARVELHCVGKEAGNHPVPQEEINALLLALAREGKRVARLKGGDPFVFGRGGEEAEALRAAGIPFEVVPGVTAGVAAPACAGIPVTHRREAVRLTLLTAHESAKADGAQVRWDLLARDPNATLVGYMGVSSLPHVVDRLITAGMDPQTPAALIERGATAGQRVVRATLAQLPQEAVRAAIQPPALFVISPTVRHAERLDWWSERPLAGERFLIPMPAGGAGETLDLAGVEVIAAPLPLTPAARVAIAAAPLTGCLVRHEAEVDALDEERGLPGWEGEVIAWCLGPAVAERARARGWRGVEELPAELGGEELVAALVARRRGPVRGGG
ncbi:MAG: siroheme synthase CysG [Acidobacteriota bacterium]